MEQIENPKCAVLPSDAVQQVRDQIVTISRLRKQNDHYLTNVERAWLDSILISARTVIGGLDSEEESAVKGYRTSCKLSGDRTFLAKVKNIIQSSPKAARELTQLLVVARTLDSATSLLSCSSERYKWSTCHVKAIPLVGEDFHHDLAQLLEGLDSQRGRISQIFRAASINTRGSRVLDPTSHWAEESSRDATRSKYSSRNSTVSLNESQTNEILSQVIIESIDNWKINAEIALESATQQSSPSNISDDVPGLSTGSASQYSWSPGMITPLERSEKPANQAILVHTADARTQTTSPSCSSPEGVSSYGELHIDPRIPSTSRDYRSRPTPNRYMQILRQSYHPSASNVYHSVETPQTEQRKPGMEENRQVGTSRTSSSQTSEDHSEVMGVARLVFIPKAIPKPNEHDVSGLGISTSSRDSPEWNASTTTICAVDKLASPANRRISRGRAWLERQVEARSQLS